MKHFLTCVSLLLIMSFSGILEGYAAISVAPASAIQPKGDPDPAAVRAAVKEFRSLSRKERKNRFKEVKKAIRQYKADKKAGRADADTNTLLLVILAILLPPLAVYLHEGEINTRFWISLILTLLFWLPGVIYALVVILSDRT